MSEQTTAVKILSETEDAVIVGGYGIVFGGKDLEGETFTPETDYQLGVVPVKSVYYDHSMNAAVPDSVGRTVKEEPDDVGVWVEAQIERARAYGEQVIKLIEEGVLGWSSGTVAHLARRDGGIIKSWPVFEYSLTPTPAEPRTVGVERIKAMAKDDPSLKAFLPESAQDSASEGATVEQSEPANQPPETPAKEDIKMAENEVVTESAPALTLEQIQEAFKTVVDPLNERLEKIEKTAVNEIPAAAPAVNKTGLGDSEAKALKWYVKTGDASGFKAANNTIGNITTAADGGNAVPTAHYQGIIARRDELMLADKLGLQRFGGKGTTMNVPLDAEADVEFAATAEQDDSYAQTYTRDFPALGTLALTLAKKTKKIFITEELMEDEDSNLMAFLNNYVGRAFASYHNYLLVTAAVAGGTAVTLDGASAVTVAEIPEIVWSLPDGYEDNTAWIMKKATAGNIFAKQAGSDSGMFMFSQTPSGSGDPGQPYLHFSPVHFSSSVAAIGGGNVSLIYGNFNFMALRDGALTFIRDPYTTDGGVYLKYNFRAAYGVLQAEAIRLGTHPTG